MQANLSITGILLGILEEFRSHLIFRKEFLKKCNDIFLTKQYKQMAAEFSKNSIRKTGNAVDFTYYPKYIPSTINTNFIL